MNLSVRRSTIVFVAGLLSWAGCEMQEASRPDPALSNRAIATQSPNPYPFSVPFPLLNDCYPSGSRIVVVSMGAADAPEKILSKGLAAAGAPAVSPDATRVVFAGKQSADANWSIYETSLRGGAPRLWISMEGDCGDPAYLSNDSIVFACLSEKGTWRLFTVARGLSEPRPITFGTDSARYPTVLRDGRILFSREQTSPNQSSKSISLFTVNPDGTLLDGFTESHADGEAHLRSGQSPDETRAAFLCVSPQTAFPRVAVAALGFPTQLSFPNAPLLQASCVNALEDGALVAAGRLSEGPGGFGIYRLTDSAVEVAFDNPEWNEIEVVPITRRRPPLGRPSQHDSSKAYGELVCYDVHRTDGKANPAEEGSVAASFQVETADGSCFGPFGLNDDGAFYLNVPPDVSLRIRTFDREGKPRATCNWIWVRPGEKRACFGCHEGLASAPVNRPLPTLSQPPVDLLGKPNPK